MKTATGFYSCLAAALIFVLSSAGIAAAQFNTSLGNFALEDETTQTDATAIGYQALRDNTTGNGNTAIGVNALVNSTTGGENTASGMSALNANTTGTYNTATGDQAMGNSSEDGEGSYNTAEGASALFQNTTGNNNIAVGFEAGENLTTGSNNIDIGNEGLAGESNTIRIGTQGTQTATYIAGINGPSPFYGLPVVVNPETGRLAVFGFSSARYKRDIRDMGAASDGLLKLRPVSFRYKQDPEGALQYGLIAEEVVRVYPELVTHSDDGKVEGVRYELLPALLLNEVQKQAREKDAQIAALRQQVASQEKQIDALKKKDAQIDALAERMNALERQARLARPEHLASAMTLGSGLPCNMNRPGLGPISNWH
jgi:hypothetical protein